MWVYMKGANNLYDVGFYKSNGEFYDIESLMEEKDARELVNYLNGGEGRRFPAGG